MAMRSIAYSSSSGKELQEEPETSGIDSNTGPTVIRIFPGSSPSCAVQLKDPGPGTEYQECIGVGTPRFVMPFFIILTARAVGLSGSHRRAMSYTVCGVKLAALGSLQLSPHISDPGLIIV